MDASISFKVSKVFANTHSVSSLCAVPTAGTGLLVRLWGEVDASDTTHTDRFWVPG